MPRSEISVFVFIAAGMLILLLLAAIFVLKPRNRKRRSKSEPRPKSGPREILGYRRQSHFLTDAERSFFGVLHSVASPWFYIAPKVRLYDLVEPQKGLSASMRQTALNLISRRHCDFVLCSPDTMQPVMVIELDDSSHAAAERRAKDAQLDEALSSAGIPLLRIPCAQSYSPQNLTEKIKSALHANE